MNKEVVEEEEVVGGHAPCPVQRQGVVLAAPDQTPCGDLHCILWRIRHVNRVVLPGYFLKCFQRQYINRYF